MDTQDNEGALAATGKRLRERAAELTRVVAEDLVHGLDLTHGKVQQEVAGAISGALEDVELGLSGLPAWKRQKDLANAFSDEKTVALEQAIETAQKDFAEALNLAEREQSDTRLQLKALGARWHEAHRRQKEVTDCPLCDQPLTDPAMAAELESLRHCAEAVTRRLEDNLNAILAQLDVALAQTVTLHDVSVFAPRQKLLEDISQRFVARDRYRDHLASFTKLVSEALAHAPFPELDVEHIAIGPKLNVADAVKARIGTARGVLSLVRWFNDNAENWRTWWDVVARGITPPQSTAMETGTKRVASTKETLVQHLTRLSEGTAIAAPYRGAADALNRAWKHGREARKFEEEQERREAIASNLIPLKALGSLAEAQARIAIAALSEDIFNIMSRIHLDERLTFKGAELRRKHGLVVHAGLDPALKIDATLVANTSWLRALLWAFLFALRNEAVNQLGSDPFPLLVLDDPQATFDSEHRSRWAQEIVGLQADTVPAQILLTTHDEIFLELIKVDGVKGREAFIAAASPELGCAGIFEGAALERHWAKTKVENTPIAGQNYITAVRVYAEGMLRLMLRGQSFGVTSPTTGFVLGHSRERLRQLNAARLAPWDKSEFKCLVEQLDKAISAINYLEISHHAGRTHLGMGEAKDVEQHWRKKLEPALRRGFCMAREHLILHGALDALYANPPSCILPDGYKAKLRSFRLEVIGRAAAFSGGVPADGRISFTQCSSGDIFVLGRHFAFRLNAPTLEPLARKGDILLVREIGEPSTRSLVVARNEDRVVARRFEIADNHSDVAVLTAQAVNPRQIAPPIVAKRATLELRKVIGVLFDPGGAIGSRGEEVCDCGGEAILQRYATSIQGLIEVDGNSAEPIALDRQFLMIGASFSAEEALHKWDGQPLIASDGNGNHYFKRLRRSSASIVVLESLEISGDFGPIVLTQRTGKTTDLGCVWPVFGVLFERP